MDRLLGVSDTHHAPPTATGWQGQLFSEPSFSELCDWYEEHCLQHVQRANTRHTRKSAITQAREWMDSRGYTHPGPGEWREYFTSRLSARSDTRVCRSTLDTYRKVLAQVYTFARDTPRRGMGGWAALANPLSRHHIPKFKEPLSRPRGLAEPYTTFPLLLQAMPDPLSRAFLAVQRFDLLRVQEALGIPLPGGRIDDNRRHLNLDSGLLYVAMQRDTQEAGTEPQPLKSDFSAATLELHEETVRMLREGMRWARERMTTPAWRRTAGFAARNYVFPYYRETLEKLLKACREVAPGDFPTWRRGVDGADGFHVFRHTGAFGLLQAGVPEAELHRQLRHKDRHTTHVYLQKLQGEVVSSDGLREARRVEMLKQQRALAERDGKGLRVVKQEE